MSLKIEFVSFHPSLVLFLPLLCNTIVFIKISQKSVHLIPNDKSIIRRREGLPV